MSSGASPPHVDGGDMQMVGVGMRFAGQDLSYDYAAKSAADAFNFLDRIAFQTRRGQNRRQFTRLHANGYIPLQPFI